MPSDDSLQMMSGQSAADACFLVPNDGGLLPSTLDGYTRPPAGTPNTFFSWATTRSVRGYALSVNWTSPANSSLTVLPDITVANFMPTCGGQAVAACIAQPDTTNLLDSMGDRVMYRAPVRVLADGTMSVLITHAVQVNDAQSMRWYELRLINAAWSLYQQGTLPYDGVSRWMGSIAQDRVGNIFLGYSVSSTSVYPGIRVAARAPTDALGTMSTELTLRNGTGSQV
jgi:hypothetical protein